MEGSQVPNMRKLVIGSIAVITASLPAVSQELQPLEPVTTVEELPVEARPDSPTYLVLTLGKSLRGNGIVSLPMKSLDQCEEQGAKWMASSRIPTYLDQPLEYRGFECFEGAR